MGDSTREARSDYFQILQIMDQALLRHLERITGTSQGINGLPMDLMTVSCIVLLTESSEEGGDSDGHGGSMSRSRLEEELEEMGLGDSSMLDLTLQRMAQAGYIAVDGKQRVVAEKPTISMARLLEHAFPGMPGMNLVAYFVQTMDEVETGRKDPAEALMYLDQILRRHGAAPFRTSAAGRQGGPERASAQPDNARPRTTPSGPPPGAPRFKSPVRSAEKRLVFRAPKPKAPAAPGEGITVREDGAEEISAAVEAPPITAPIPESPPDVPPVPVTSEEPSSPQGPPAEPDLGITTPDEPTLSPLIESPEETEEETGGPAEDGIETAAEGENEAGEGDGVETVVGEGIETGVEEDAEDTAGVGIQEEPEEEAGTGPIQPPPEPEPPSETNVEDQVEERIAAFEENLAMQCPLCREASVEVKETAKGRVYYKCSSEQCMFISWGLPHHTPCPRCGNPFLVEATSGSGEIILKCPRATCRYKTSAEGDPLPEAKAGSDGVPVPPPVRKAKKRVVKRRVVRRKR